MFCKNCSNIVLENTTIQENFLVGKDAHGGGIFVEASSTLLFRSVIGVIFFCLLFLTTNFSPAANNSMTSAKGGYGAGFHLKSCKTIIVQSSSGKCYRFKKSFTL